MAKHFFLSVELISVADIVILSDWFIFKLGVGVDACMRVC